jgi:DNA-directed RNA polymerase specialized sigma24 family protein
MDAVGYPDFAAQQSRELLRVGWLLTGDWAVAEDLVQTTLAHAWLHWASVEEAQRPAWVRSLVLRTYVRSRRSASTADGNAAVHQPLLHALAGLSRRQRAVAVLRHFIGLTDQQTAAELRCSPSAVRRDDARAVARLGALADPARLDERLRALTPEPPSDTGVRTAGAGGFTVPGTRPTSVWVAFAVAALIVALLAALVLAIRNPGPEDGSGLPPTSSSSAAG